MIAAAKIVVVSFGVSRSVPGELLFPLGHQLQLHLIGNRRSNFTMDIEDSGQAAVVVFSPISGSGPALESAER